MMRPITRFGQALATRQDLFLITLLLTIIFMIILPLPTWLIDLLIGINLSLVMLVLIVTIYLKSPVAFSTLPTILLFATLFRLAISISTTRLILVQADAGQIVETFGRVVLGGSIIVGLVVFLIITIVQFVVITKGSERVAEVSARFSLDALPGRQMSIDSDMRAGEIDITEARRRREALQLESEFYGSMDGAMKFVKGDAIAGLIIILVNILGGMAVGAGQQGMDFGAAAQRYSTLTVGDGLVSQIPALLMAISSGIVITRITREESSDLGRDIAGQMSASPRALQIAAGVLFLFAFIPGFPTVIFLVLATAMLGAGIWAQVTIARRATDEVTQAPTASDLRQDLMMTPMPPVHVAVGPGLDAALDKGRFRAEATAERKSLFEQLGVPFPSVILTPDDTLEPGAWRLIIENVPVADGELPLGRVRLRDDPEAAAIVGIEATEVALGTVLPVTHWCDAGQVSELDAAGLAWEPPERTLAMLVGQCLPRHAGEFLGVHEAGTILNAMEARYDSLVAEVQKAMPIQRIAQVMRRLVEEEVPIRNMRILLETLIEWGGREKDAEALAEYVRVALSRQISHRHADPDRFIPALVVESDVEEAVRGALRQSSAGTFLQLGATDARTLLSSVRKAVGDLTAHATVPVVLSTMDTRRHLRRFLAEHDIHCPVLSHREIAPNYKVQPLAMVTMK